MGIINVTTDSFYALSRVNDDDDIALRATQLIANGADILDIGACSTRPGADVVSEDEEYSALARALDKIREVLPDAVLSVDTFRSNIARKCVEQWNVDIINDIGGGSMDPGMFATIADLQVPYVLTHSRGTPATMNNLTDYSDVTAEVITELSKKVYELHGLKVNDIIIDPGFGFAKTTAQNFQLLHELGEFCRMGMPVMAGLSRKSMIWKTLSITPDESLEGTIVLNTVALQNGADILRVHDVKEAVTAVKLVMAVENDGNS